MCELLPEYTTMKKEKVLICKVKCKTRQRAIYQLLNPSPTAGHLTPSTEVHLFWKINLMCINPTPTASPPFKTARVET